MSLEQTGSHGSAAGGHDDVIDECSMCVDGAPCGPTGCLGPYGPMGPLSRALLWVWRVLQELLLLLLGHCLVRVGSDTLWVFHPDRKWRWDLVVMLLVVYTAVETPFTQAFQPEWPWADAFGLAVDAVFLLDVLVNLRSAYWDSSRKLEIRAGHVARRYATTWMPIDVLSSVPFELLADLVATTQGDPLGDLRIISGLKAIRLVRLHRLTSVLARLRNSSVFGIFRLYGAILLLGHWLACSWFVLITSQTPSGVGETWALNAGINGYFMVTPHDIEQERRGLDNASLTPDPPFSVPAVGADGQAATLSPVGPGGGLPLSPYVRAVRARSIWYNYVTCLVDVIMALFRTQRFRSTTIPESLFLLLLVLLGAAMQAVVFGQVAFLVSKFNSHRSEFERSLSDVRDRMHYHRLPPSLVERVSDYYERQFDTHRLGVGASDPVAWAKGIANGPLENEVLLYVHRDLITKVDIFRGAPPAVVIKIVKALRSELFLPGDYVVKLGEVGSSMFFIRSGECQVLLPVEDGSAGEEEDDVVVDGMREAKVLSAGAAFGELALLFATERTATVVATTYSDLSALSQTDFDRILEENMEFGLLLMANFQHYIQQDYEGATTVGGASLPDGPSSARGSSRPETPSVHGADEIGAAVSRTPFLAPGMSQDLTSYDHGRVVTAGHGDVAGGGRGGAVSSSSSSHGSEGGTSSGASSSGTESADGDGSASRAGRRRGGGWSDGGLSDGQDTDADATARATDDVPGGSEGGLDDGGVEEEEGSASPRSRSSGAGGHTSLMRMARAEYRRSINALAGPSGSSSRSGSRGGRRRGPGRSNQPTARERVQVAARAVQTARRSVAGVEDVTDPSSRAKPRPMVRGAARADARAAGPSDGSRQRRRVVESRESGPSVVTRHTRASLEEMATQPVNRVIRRRRSSLLAALRQADTIRGGATGQSAAEFSAGSSPHGGGGARRGSAGSASAAPDVGEEEQAAALLVKEETLRRERAEARAEEKRSKRRARREKRERRARREAAKAAASGPESPDAHVARLFRGGGGGGGGASGDLTSEQGGMGRQPSGREDGDPSSAASGVTSAGSGDGLGPLRGAQFRPPRKSQSELNLRAVLGREENTAGVRVGRAGGQAAAAAAGAARAGPSHASSSSVLRAAADAGVAAPHSQFSFQHRSSPSYHSRFHTGARAFTAAIIAAVASSASRRCSEDAATTTEASVTPTLPVRCHSATASSR